VDEPLAHVLADPVLVGEGGECCDPRRQSTE
jgi:hypothetical protein